MSAGRARPWIVLASASLAGCITVGPDYESPATAVPAAWTRLDSVSAPAIEVTAAGDLERVVAAPRRPAAVGTRRRGGALRPGPQERRGSPARGARTTGRRRRRLLPGCRRFRRGEPEPVERGDRQRHHARVVCGGLRCPLGAGRVRRHATQRGGGRCRRRVRGRKPRGHAGHAGRRGGGELRRGPRPAGPDPHRTRQPRQPVGNAADHRVARAGGTRDAPRKSSRRAPTASGRGR